MIRMYKYLLLPLFVMFVLESLRFIFREQFALFPSTAETIRYFFLHLPRLVFHASITLREVLLGFACSVLLAFPLAWLMVLNEDVCNFFQSTFVVVQCVPMFTLAPIMVTLFGWTFMAILIPTILMIIFPLTISIFKGFSQVSKPMLNYFRFHGASEWKILVKLRIPYAMPNIFAGLRISTAIAGVGAVAGEWAGAQDGLGVYLQMCRRNIDMSGVFCGIILLVAISLILYNVVVLIERKWVRFESCN